MASTRPFTRQLAALVLGLLVPTSLFVGILLRHLAASERTPVEEQARGLSHGLAVALDREVTSLRTALRALATSPSLGTHDLPILYGQASEVRRLQDVHISLRELDGRFAITTRAPLGTVLVARSALGEADAEAIRTRGPYRLCRITVQQMSFVS